MDNNNSVKLGSSMYHIEKSLRSFNNKSIGSVFYSRWKMLKDFNANGFEIRYGGTLILSALSFTEHEKDCIEGLETAIKDTIEIAKIIHAPAGNGKILTLKHTDKLKQIWKSYLKKKGNKVNVSDSLDKIFNTYLFYMPHATGNILDADSVCTYSHVWKAVRNLLFNIAYLSNERRELV